MNESPILKTEKLCHVYSAGTPFETAALRDVDLEIRRGELVAVIGHTGSGKSTLIQHLNGLMKPTSGRVLFEGADIGASKQATKNARCKVGLVFQYPEYQLFEETVYKDIAFGPRNMRLSADDVDVRVREAARFVGIGAELLGRSPFELSGGQKRRIAIAGVIAMLPQVLILDEPMAGLDPAGRDGIMENILGYHEETGAAVVVVTHSMEDAARNAERMIVMSRGRIVMDGAPGEIFSRGDELSPIGLDVPVMTRLADRLRAMGVPVKGSVYTVEQARDAVLALKGGGGAC